MELKHMMPGCDLSFGFFILYCNLLHFVAIIVITNKDWNKHRRFRFMVRGTPRSSRFPWHTEQLSGRC